MANQGKILIADMDPEAVQYIRLFHYMKEYHVLPRAGGVLDQDAELLAIFDFIEEVLRDLENG